MKTLPQQFKDMIMESALPSPAALLETLSKTDPSVSIRLNPAKPCEVPYPISPVPWSEGTGYYLTQRPKFTLDPLIHAGGYYVQDASSMIIAYILRRLTEGSGPLTYLDACAAPGGKTTAAISSLPQGSLVVANEYVPSRAAVLKENLIKWGSPDTVVTVGDTSRFKSSSGGMFDIVAADVPCSGEGMMRKDEEAVSQWSNALIGQCAARQREIIGNLWDTLKPGGWLIYSTCTFNTVENEEMVRYIADTFGAEIRSLDFPSEWGIFTNGYGGRFLPHLLKGEGLFISVLKKPSDTVSLSSLSARTNKKKVSRKGENGLKIDKSLIETAKAWMISPEKYDFSLRENNIVAFPKYSAPTLSFLESGLKIIHSGVHVAEIKGRDLIPTHQLAMSTALRREAFPSIELDRDAAIEYLRRETPSSPLLEDKPKGHILMTYHGLPLGWIKNIGSRANNLYPKEWKILTS